MAILCAWVQIKGNLFYSPPLFYFFSLLAFSSDSFLGRNFMLYFQGYCNPVFCDYLGNETIMDKMEKYSMFVS